MIIGFGHVSRTGKDECAKFAKTYLESKGVTVAVLAFADALKDVSYKLGLTEPKDYYETHPEKKTQEVVDTWVTLGQTIRSIVPTVWRDYVRQQVERSAYDVYLIPDMRFFNEFKWIQDNGIVIKVNRPGFSPKSESDAALSALEDSKWDYIINNNGSLPYLEVLMQNILQEEIKNGSIQ